MNLLASPSLRTDERPDRRMTHITCRALKQVTKLLKGLSKSDRDQLREDVFRPAPSQRCELVLQAAKYGLFHYRARGGHGIRICFCRLNGTDTLILDIARHNEFEEFASNFTGSYGKYIPIQEAPVMSNESTNGSNPKDPQPVTPGSTQAVLASGAALAELLAEQVFGSRPWAEKEKDIELTIELYMDRARDAAITKIEGEMENLVGRIDDHKAAFAEVGSGLDAMKKKVNNLETKMAVESENVDSSLKTLAIILSSVQSELSTAITNSDGNSANIKEDIHKLREVLDALTATVAENQTSSLVAQMEQFGRDMEGIERRLTSTQEGLLRSSKQAEETRELEKEKALFLKVETDEQISSLANQIDAIETTQRDLVARLDREQQEMKQRSLKARLAILVNYIGSVFDEMRWRRVNH